jgi:glycosyltransferase involved in cell wall biosynthesis
MKVIQLHQRYRSRGGEDVMVDATAAVLRERGVDVRLVTRDSRDLKSFPARLRAFATGVYSFAAGREMAALLARERPDLVHIHNLHPLFSPSVIRAARRAGVPVVMTCHNFRLVCPTGMHIRRGQVCERCLGGREHWCALLNCQGNLFESVGYAVRNAVHRRLRLFTDQVTLFLAISRFMRDRLEAAGLPAARLAVVPNMVRLPAAPVEAGRPGGYVAFAGRFGPEKGIDTLVEAARRAGLPLRLAGDPAGLPGIARRAPAGTVFAGLLSPAEMARFYRGARFVAVPSRCLEGFGLVAAEAMSHGLPVVASRIGGLAEVVGDGATGLLVEPGNAEELAAAMRRLWDDPELCRRLGAAGRAKAAREYSPEVFFDRLTSAYQHALAMPAGAYQAAPTPSPAGPQVSFPSRRLVS